MISTRPCEIFRFTLHPPPHILLQEYRSGAWKGTIQTGRICAEILSPWSWGGLVLPHVFLHSSRFKLLTLLPISLFCWIPWRVVSHGRCRYLEEEEYCHLPIILQVARFMGSTVFEAIDWNVSSSLWRIKDLFGPARTILVWMARIMSNFEYKFWNMEENCVWKKIVLGGELRSSHLHSNVHDLFFRKHSVLANWALFLSKFCRACLEGSVCVRVKIKCLPHISQWSILPKCVRR